MAHKRLADNAKIRLSVPSLQGSFSRRIRNKDCRQSRISIAPKSWDVQEVRHVQASRIQSRLFATQTVMPGISAQEPEGLVECAIVIPEGVASPLGKYERVEWEEVMMHIVKRLSNIDPKFKAHVFTDRQLQEPGEKHKFSETVKRSSILLICGIQDEAASSSISEASADLKTVLAFDCNDGLKSLTRLDGIQADSIWSKVFGRLRFTRSARSKKILSTVEEFWSRETSDDLLYIFLVLIDAFVVEVETVRALRAQDLKSIQCMITNCRAQIFDCLSTPECNAGLDCLQQCAPNDQVCSYRCIATHESKQFEAFSLCILQKHNCLGLNVKIPSRPDPAPMTSFRGETLTHEIAESLFIGWLGEKEWSWRVVGGQNAAYDQFPCQYQLYYRGKGKDVLWYDPIFQVKTYDGRTLWRRRHYRVKRSSKPGTFRFSVLDNGVTSNEFWRILDVADDLSWGLFFYSGAASVVGQSYTGAVLCTPDGSWPSAHEARIKEALTRADIKMWEMFRVDNSCCTSAPLGLGWKDASADALRGGLKAKPQAIPQ